MSREFRRVGVVGLGTMGAGIAEVLARGGIEVVGVELDERALERGRAHIEKSTSRAVSRGKLTEEAKDQILARVSFASTIDGLAGTGLVIEAVPERLELKRDVVGAIDRACPPETVIATNTSSLPVTEVATATGRPSRVVGVHFFNPAPVMKLVEIVHTVVTEPEVTSGVEKLVRSLGKRPVRCGDRAGFIANHLLFGYLNQAAAMYESGQASREDIDAAMRLGADLPMGPLTLLDLIGVDTAYEVCEALFAEFRDRRYAPAPAITQMVTAGLLGRKSGRGFYTYEAPGSATVVPDSLTPPGRDAEPRAERVESIGVVGAGELATGVVESCARAGYDVTFVARGEEQASALVSSVERALEEHVSRGKLDELGKKAALQRVHPSQDLADLGGCGLIAEAADEDLETKRSLFAELGGVAPPGAVLATMTSSIPVIDMAVASNRPGDVVGMHVLTSNPATKVIEVVETVLTSPHTAAVAREVCHRFARTPVRCGDRAGFITGALLFPYLNDAVAMLENGYASADDIDAAMKLGCGYPMGPLEMLDAIGLDRVLAVQRAIYREAREPGLAPSPLLERLVTAGYLGRRSGWGVRDYAQA